MVDINYKANQTRIARASGKILVQKQTLQNIKKVNLKKGDVITTAKIAGIQAAKNTPLLIPLCHQLSLDKVDIDIRLKSDFKNDFIEVTAFTKSFGKTGVEIEALTAVQIALLTIYDMCKAIDKSMVITDIKLIEKTKAIPHKVDKKKAIPPKKT